LNLITLAQEYSDNDKAREMLDQNALAAWCRIAALQGG